MSQADQWVLLWSKRQNCFHIQPAQKLFETNTEAMKLGKALNDYHPVFMGTLDQCKTAADNSRHLLMGRARNVV